MGRSSCACVNDCSILAKLTTMTCCAPNGTETKGIETKGIETKGIETKVIETNVMKTDAIRAKIFGPQNSGEHGLFYYL